MFHITSRWMSHSNAGIMSYTGKMFHNLNNFRNGYNSPQEDAPAATVSCGENLIRTAVAQAGYALLAVAWLVELAVRTFFVLFLTLGIVCSQEGSPERFGDLITTFFIVHLIDTPLRVFNAFFGNFFHSYIHYDEMTPCGPCFTLPRAFCEILP